LLVVLAAAGIGVRWSVIGILGTLVMLMLGTAAFACMSMLLAAGVRERERFMGIGQLIMMPLFFASSALYPLSVMPGWLHAVARGGDHVRGRRGRSNQRLSRAARRARAGPGDDRDPRGRWPARSHPRRVQPPCEYRLRHARRGPLHARRGAAADGRRAGADE